MSGMTKHWWRWYVRFVALGSLLGMGGAISCGASIFSTNPALAQITLDTTLPNNSTVKLEGNTRIIEGGTKAGSNLFHSFEQFSVLTGSTAYFNNATDIQNIISRVTGKSVSNIDGLIRANGKANLFLINPNGIIFGKNASLNIGGSFLASTASSLKFADGFAFSATAPQTPPLLTISVPIGLQYGINPGSIQNQSQATNSNGKTVGLQVQPGKTLALVGGNVSLDGGTMLAPGGMIELGGVAGTGMVGLQVEGDNLDLNFPNGVTRTDVSLTNAAQVNVLAGGGGNIAINAQNLNLAGGSKLQAGIALGNGSVDSKAGNIDINATGAIKLTGGSFIENLVGSSAVGKGGDINIQAESVSFTDGSNLIASTFGKGDAGNVNINARDTVSFDGEDHGSFPYSGVYNLVEAGAVGNGGNVNVKTGSLSVTNGAALQANTAGQGNAGNVNIDVRDIASFDGEGADFFSSGAYSQVQKGSVGNGGNVNVKTGSLSVTNGAALQASTEGRGNAGNVNTDVRNTASFDGEGGDFFSSGAYSQVKAGSVGERGSVNVMAGSLSVTNGAILQASTEGRGNAGNVNIDIRDTASFDGEGSFNGKFRQSSGAYSQVQKGSVGNGGNVNVKTGSLSVTNGAALTAETYGQGNGGNVNIDVRDTASFDGEGADFFSSGAYSNVESSGMGNGNNVNVTAGSLFLTRGAVLSTSTNGMGSAGNVNINVRNAIAFDGEGRLQGDFRHTSGAFSSVQMNGVGHGGSINVKTGSLSLTHGGVLAASTLGHGSGGSVTINADTLAFDGIGLDSFPSGIYSQVKEDVVGNGGNVNVTTGSLFLTNGALLSVSSNGIGAAGNLEITARSIKLDNQARLTAETALGNGGNISFQVGDLQLLRHGSIISATAGTAQSGGNGGNITINAPNGFIVAAPNENSDITANAFTGTGGKVQINATGIFGMTVRNREDLVRLLGTNDLAQLDPQRLPTNDITAISQTNPNFSGTITINTPDVDPSRGLVQLSTNLFDASSQIDNSCNPGSKQRASSFTITGRGGLPPNPKTEPLTPDAVQVDWVSLKPSTRNHNRPTATKKPTNPTPAPIVQATGWTRNAKGEVVLTADASNITPQSPWQNPPPCHTSQNN